MTASAAVSDCCLTAVRRIGMILVSALIAVLVVVIFYLVTHGNSYHDRRMDSPAGSGSMFDSVAPFYDIANRFMSIGFDQSWRRSLIISLKLQKEDLVLDVSTGTADVAILMAKSLQSMGKINGHPIIGLDPSGNMLLYGADKLRVEHLESMVRLVQGDAQDMRNFADESFDKISQSFGIRNVPDRRKALAEMFRIIKFDGVIGILEFSAPQKGPLQPLAMFFLKTVVPEIGRVLSGGLKSEYEHLKDSILTFPSPNEFISMMEETGFAGCIANDLFFDSVYLYICRKVQLIEVR